MSVLRPLPSNYDAERGLLGSMLTDANVIDSCANLEPEAFHLPAHASLFEVLREMRTKLMAVDIITASAAFKARQAVVAEQGGSPGVENVDAFITDLFTFCPTAVNWDFYAEIVRNEYIRRKVIAGCTRMVQAAYAHTGASDDLLNEVEQTVMAMRAGGKSEDALKPVKTFVNDAILSLESVYANRGKPVGLTTGLTHLDRMTGGLKPTLLYVIAGRPSMGKTVLGVQIGLHNALAGHPVAMYTLEMSGAELAERMIGTQASVNLQRWRDGFLEKNDLPRISKTADDLAKSPLYLDETPGLTIMDLRARARRAVSKRGVKLIVVDYLQLMRAPSKRADFSRAAEVADISMGLKAMAKELRVPVIVCAQLNRENDGRRPALSNLRESGQIEQDADVAVLIHRPWKDKEKDPDQVSDFARNGEPAEAIVAKQRNGPIGDVALRFFGQFTRFETDDNAPLYSNNKDKRQKRGKGGENE